MTRTTLRVECPAVGGDLEITSDDDGDLCIKVDGAAAFHPDTVDEIIEALTKIRDEARETKKVNGDA